MIPQTLDLLPDYLPDDCVEIISEFIPQNTEERCFICSLPLIITDLRGRIHFHDYLVCTESILLCQPCFDTFYKK